MGVADENEEKGVKWPLKMFFMWINKLDRMRCLQVAKLKSYSLQLTPSRLSFEK